MCVCEELVWGGSKKDSSVLKDLVTSEYQTINPKFCQPRVEKSFLSLVILTNASWAVQAGMSARRYFVLNPSDRFTGVQSQEAKAYFDKIVAVKPESFAHFLYHRDLTGFNSRQPPQTNGLIQQKKHSMNAVEAMLWECLQRGWVLQGHGWSKEINALPRSTMFTMLSKSFGNVHGFPAAPQRFWHLLRTAFTDKSGVCLLQDLYDGNYRKAEIEHLDMEEYGGGYNAIVRDRWVALPSLQVCRNWWSEHMFPDTWGQ
jgi:hypothetical protein